MRRSFWQHLQHAFATGPAGPCVATEQQQVLIDRVCRWAIQRQMTLPLQMALESSAPLGSLAGQSIPVLEPWLGLILNEGQIRELRQFLEHPGAIEYLSQRLDALSRQADADSPQPAGPVGS